MKQIQNIPNIFLFACVWIWDSTHFSMINYRSWVEKTGKMSATATSELEKKRLNLRTLHSILIWMKCVFGIHRWHYYTGCIRYWHVWVLSSEFSYHRKYTYMWQVWMRLCENWWKKGKKKRQKRRFEGRFSLLRLASVIYFRTDNGMRKGKKSKQRINFNYMLKIHK